MLSVYICLHLTHLSFIYVYVHNHNVLLHVLSLFLRR